MLHCKQIFSLITIGRIFVLIFNHYYSRSFNPHPLFFAQSPDFLKPGLCYFPKLHFCPYICNQTVLFPQRIDESIAENDPVRIINAVVDGLNVDNFRKLYKESGRSPYHPRMMLKVILYAYMNNIYSCRRIEKLRKFGLIKSF